MLCLPLLTPVGFRIAAEVREAEPAESIAPGRFVRGNDVDVHILEAGPPDGPPVVLVHGTSAWAGTWRDTTKALAIAGYRVIALDLPPFGYSSQPEDDDYSRVAQGRRIQAVMDVLEVDDVVLVGHSFGGGPTFEAASSPRVGRLVLVNVAIGLGQPAADGVAMNLLVDSKLTPLVVASTLNNPWLTKKGVEHFVADPADATPDRVALYQEPLRVQGATNAVAAWLPELMAPSGTPSSLDPAAWRAYDRPTLLLWGSEDDVTPLSQAVELHGLLPNSTLVPLDGLGHIPHIEDVDLFNQALITGIR